MVDVELKNILDDLQCKLESVRYLELSCAYSISRLLPSVARLLPSVASLSKRRCVSTIGAFAGDHYVFTLADGDRIAQIHVEATQLLNSVSRQLQHQVLLCLFTVLILR